MRPGLPLVAALLLCCTGGARADTLNIEAAKGHFAAGKAYYEEKRWDEALKEFSEAYRLSKRTALLFNIGVCQERLERYEDAVASLRSYLLLEPNAEDRPSVEKKIGELEQRLGKQPTAPPKGERGAARPPPPSPQQPIEKPRRVATWIVGAAGVAMLGAALGTGVASHQDFASLTSDCGPTRNACPPGFAELRDEGKRLQITTDVLLAIGAAAVVGSVLLYVFEPRIHRRSRLAAVAPLVLAGGAGIAGSLRF